LHKDVKNYHDEKDVIQKLTGWCILLIVLMPDIYYFLNRARWLNMGSGNMIFDLTRTCLFFHLVWLSQSGATSPLLVPRSSLVN
jgi:hypothetical protein